MKVIDILNKAADLIDGRGLATGTAEDKRGRVCSASALLRSSRRSETGKLDETAYLEARKHFANTLGIFPSYQAIVDWNDSVRTNSEGIQISRRTKEEVVKAFRKAAKAAALEVEES